MTQQQYWTLDQATREVISGPHAAQFRGGIWHTPANALTTEPLPAKPGFAVLALAGGSGTEYVEDHRGKTVCHKQTKAEREISDLGPVPDTETELAPGQDDVWDEATTSWQLDPDAITRHQKIQYTEINQWRDKQEAENLLFTHAGHTWDGGNASRARMEETLALANATGSLPPGFFWTTAANVDVTMTATELKTLADAMAAARGQRGFEIHARQRLMKTEVETLANVGENPTQEQLSAAIAAVQAYTVGWPEVPNAG